ncbi:MAG: hypothetical protein R2737_00100 [Candidatus Nanopelagicales bacterium]
MTRLAPAWALTAAAVFADADPHLRPGVHLRVLPSTRIGLPVAPMLVERRLLGRAERLLRPADVVWTDAAGAPLAVPFDAGAVGPATAWLPSQPGNPVVYAQVVVEPDQRPGRGPVRWPVDLEPVVGRPRTPVRWPVTRRGLRVDAVVASLLGPAVVASAEGEPYAVAATGMDRLVVTGWGRVLGVRLLRAGDLKPEHGAEPWCFLDLPVEGGARYAGFPDAWGRAKERVTRGAPQRLGLHDEPGAADPPSCPPVGPGEEWDRVETLWAERLERQLVACVDDLSAPPDELLMPPETLAGTKVGAASLRVPPLAGTLQAALDPGQGRLLGLVDLDEAPPGAPGDLVAYLVRGAFTARRAALGRMFRTVLRGGPDDPTDFPLPLPGIVRDEKEGPFADLWTVAVVVIGASPSAVPRPTVGTPEDLGWVPEVPPSARRHVVLPLSGLVPGASVAVARETPWLDGLNPRLPELFGAGAPDRAVPVVPGVLTDVGPAAAASASGQGEVHDRAAPPPATDYRVAQADWFGRWSPWASVSVAAGVRPPVPVPVLEASYLDPASPGQPGTLRVTCMQPRDPDLPPGSSPLDHLVVQAEVGAGGPVSGTAPAVRGPAPDDAEAPPVVVSIPVPPLAPAERRLVTATGFWVDMAGARSADSPPTRAVAVDPRGPAVLALPNTLEYASRPDALGRSRIRVSWPVSSGTAYRVYASDETTLRRRLDSLVASGAPGAAAARSALAAATTAPDRAAVLRDHAALFDRTCFELLTRAPLLATAAGSLSYEYEVSGSLDVLVLLKVVPVSVLALTPLPEYGGEADFGASTLLVRGVPNSAPPPQPTLTAAPDDADPGSVRLTVSVPAGQTAPVAVRLRRSRVSGADALAMPVVATDAPAAFPATLVDAGATPWDPGLRLAPWSRYTWRAEVQGAPEPGSTVPGAWSAASAPVSWQVVPPAPQDLVAGTANADAGGVAVTFTSADSLDGGPAGAYVVDVYRRSPATAAAPAGYDAVGSFPVAALRQPDGSLRMVDTTAGVPTGTEYLAEVRDPIGRRSARVVVATV